VGEDGGVSDSEEADYEVIMARWRMAEYRG
jgi:hypothetical protein